MENKDILYKLYRLLNGMAITPPLPSLERGKVTNSFHNREYPSPLSRGGRGGGHNFPIHYPDPAILFLFDNEESA